MKVLYGGTFDPVHLGHLAIAHAVCERLDCTVALMPAADPPHRRPPPGASAADRARMLELAIEEESGLSLERCELGRAGPSYTVETLRTLRQDIGMQTPLVLVLGADSFTSLPHWHDWRALFTLAHLVVARRAGCDLDNGLPQELAQAVAERWTDAPAYLRATPAGCVLRLEQPLHPATATEVRRRLETGGDWATLVPPVVAGYIRKHRLYGYNARPSSQTLPSAAIT